MTDEHAMKVWREALQAGQQDWPKPIDDRAAAAVIAADRAGLVAEVERLREENYRAFTDGMEAAAQICGSLAEVEYDDADGFDAATGCEAAIMRVVKDQRREQAALGASHDADA
jgi:hypothetical protein